MFYECVVCDKDVLAVVLINFSLVFTSQNYLQGYFQLLRE